MKVYDSYKNSGIEWLGDIPKHWEVAKIKYLFAISRGRVISQEELSQNALYPVYSSQTKNNGCLGYINTYDYDDELITWTTDGVNAGTIFLRKGKFNCTNICGTLKNKSEHINNYIKYILQIITTHSKRPDTNGAKIMNNEMAELKIILPPLHEQESIANFLDKKVAQIEKFIQDKTKFIELLKEQKEAVINETVTKGLDRSVELKDSEIEWLGDIPKHWEIRKLQYLGSLQNGINIGAEYFGKGYPFVSYGDVYSNNSIPLKVDGLVESTETDREHYSVLENDVLFTRTSETVDEVGFSSTCLETIDNSTFAGFLIRFRPKKNILHKYYSKYYFRSKLHRGFFVKEMNLVTRASLSQELLKLLPVVLPPIEEQKQIAEYIENELNQIDKLIEKTTKQIELIKEYKTSLINEAVSGKIKVG
jgi:type I restriction enzyme S subunit